MVFPLLSYEHILKINPIFRIHLRAFAMMPLRLLVHPEQDTELTAGAVRRSPVPEHHGLGPASDEPICPAVVLSYRICRGGCPDHLLLGPEPAHHTGQNTSYEGYEFPHVTSFPVAPCHSWGYGGDSPAVSPYIAPRKFGTPSRFIKETLV